MDSRRFVDMTRSLVALPSRRNLLRGLAGAGFSLPLLPIQKLDARKRKRKRTKKGKAGQPNEFGCIEVGGSCTSGSQCCSGICVGKKGKKRCQAHHTGTCPQDVAGRCGDPGSVGTCNANLGCSCFRTTAGSIACLDGARTDYTCADCRTDADCVAFGMPAGSACVPAEEGPCTIYCGGGPACLAPCPSQPPAA